MSNIGTANLCAILFLLTSGCTASADAPACAREASDFLMNPNEQTLRLVSGRNDEACWALIGASSVNLGKLDGSASSGNETATRYLIVHLNKLDGGALENALVALGVFAETKPEGFLRLSRSGELPDRHMRNAVVMLPLELSDDPSAQLRRLMLRKTAFDRIEAPDLAPQKHAALEAIDAHAEEIKRSMLP
jgi:hypothetical protein